ncbi:hypothetical protein KGF37_19180 [Clostridioides sp. ZZV14-6105]|nr:hypothetical protein [Clostridioides sp. ZZV14-6105]
MENAHFLEIISSLKIRTLEANPPGFKPPAIPFIRNETTGKSALSQPPFPLLHNRIMIALLSLRAA